MLARLATTLVVLLPSWSALVTLLALANGFPRFMSCVMVSDIVKALNAFRRLTKLPSSLHDIPVRFVHVVFIPRPHPR